MGPRSPPPPPCRLLAALCMGLVLGASTTYAHDKQASATSVPAAASDPFDICALPVTRLVFTLADLKTRECADDTECSSVCWCRQWATGPVTASTLALCVPVNATAPCAGDARDCKAVLATRNGTSASASNNAHNNTNSSSNGHTLNTIQTDKKLETDATKDKDGGGMSTGVSVAVALICAAVLVALAVAANWYRNRPRSTSTPATVMGGIQSGPSLSLTEMDSFDGDKLPGNEAWPTHRGSLASLGPMHIDHNASIISGVSGTSYHDIDGAHLGHLNEAHALTDTELSLSKDANERVFSPLSADGRSGRGSELASASFISTDSSVAMAPLGHRGGLEQFQRHQQQHQQQRGYQYGGAESDSSSFVSDVSTAYLTNNESFSSQLTIPESDNGSTTSGPKEVEF